MITREAIIGCNSITFDHYFISLYRVIHYGSQTFIICGDMQYYFKDLHIMQIFRIDPAYCQGRSLHGQLADIQAL